MPVLQAGVAGQTAADNLGIEGPSTVAWRLALEIEIERRRQEQSALCAASQHDGKDQSSGGWIANDAIT